MNATQYPMSPTITARIARLPDLEMSEIKSIWKQLFDQDVPTRNRQFLEKRIAYQWQEIEFAKTHPDILERNRQRIEQLMATVIPARRGDKLLPGTVLTREYGSAQHEVTVTADGFAYQGKPYRSLSMIAREITGTRGSGPAFFGMRPAASNKKAVAAKKKGDRK